MQQQTDLRILNLDISVPHSALLQQECIFFFLYTDNLFEFLHTKLGTWYHTCVVRKATFLLILACWSGNRN